MSRHRTRSEGRTRGATVDPPGPNTASLRITSFDYTPEAYREETVEDLSEVRHDKAGVSNMWIHVQGRVDPSLLRAIGERFGLHPLAQEDVLNRQQRPKVDSYGDQLFVVLSLPINRDNSITIDQVSLFADDNLVISFLPGPVDPFEPIRGRLRQKGSTLRLQSIDFLLYSLIDVAIDQGFPVLEVMEDEFEQLEEELLESPSRNTLRQFHEMRRLLQTLRRRLWPQREVVNNLLRDGQPIFTDHTKVYLRDCYDHTIEIMELVETYREMSSSMQEIYLSSLSYRLNDVIRVLTVIATVFMPLTFITGIYGMNFGQNPKSPFAMPELDWYWGYPLVWAVIISVAAGMLLYFRRKRWL